MTLSDLESTLTEMSVRSLAFQAVRREMQRRGHWKAKDRGISGSELMTKCDLRGLDIHSSVSRQVSYDPDAFSDGL